MKSRPQNTARGHAGCVPTQEDGALRTFKRSPEQKPPSPHLLGTTRQHPGYHLLQFSSSWLLRVFQLQRLSTETSSLQTLTGWSARKQREASDGEITHTQNNKDLGKLTVARTKQEKSKQKSMAAISRDSGRKEKLKH